MVESAFLDLVRLRLVIAGVRTSRSKSPKIARYRRMQAPILYLFHERDKILRSPARVRVHLLPVVKVALDTARVHGKVDTGAAAEALSGRRDERTVTQRRRRCGDVEAHSVGRGSEMV